MTAQTRSARPNAPAPVSESIPVELRTERRWVNWRYEQRDGKWTKVPINTRTGKGADSTDPSTWSTFEEATARYEMGGVDGIGFVLGGGWVGVDLDGLSPFALETIAQLNSYSERSPGGEGAHVILRGQKPQGARSRRDDLGIEVYDRGRFFTMTGARLPDSPATVEDRQAQIEALCGVLWPAGNGGAVNGKERGSDHADAALPEAWSLERCLAWREAFPDREVRRLLFGERKNGEKWRALWDGDTSAYDHDESRAELALVNKLAYYAGPDQVRLDQLIRQSKLMRSKWDEKRGEKTYGAMTIEKALEGMTEFYADKLQHDGDDDPHVPTDTAAVAAAVADGNHFARDPGGKLFYFDEGAYRMHGELHVCCLVKRFFIKVRKEERWTSHRAEEVIKYILADCPKLWEAPPIDELNVLNGLLDLKGYLETGRREDLRLLPHRADHLSPVQLPVNFDPAASCPNWERFISEIFPEDSQVLAWEFPAWLMVPHTGIQKAGLLLGSGGNGKSTYLAGLKAFLGRQNVSALSLHRLEMDRFAVGALVGKLANICPDLPSLHLNTASTFKALTGGDPVQGEHKFKDTFTWTPFVRLLFSANQPPRANDPSEAFFDRWLVVPLQRRFRDTEEEIPRTILDAQLAQPAELSGLLNRAIAALPGIVRAGFTETASTQEGHRLFRQTTDPLHVWLETHLVEDSSAIVEKQALRQMYNKAAQANGWPIETDTSFSLKLKRWRPTLREGQRTLGQGVDKKVAARCWLGIGLLRECAVTGDA